MRDFIGENFSPIKDQLFIWFAKYKNSIITEFENDGKENRFDDIKKEDVEEFGILGNGGQIFYNTSEGIIKLTDRDINVVLLVNEKEIYLTGNKDVDYHDIITYKHAGYDLAISGTKGEIKGRPHIDEYHLGYKTKLNIEDIGSIGYKIIYTLPMTKPSYLTVSLNSYDTDIEAKLSLRYLANNVTNDIILPKGVNKSFQILV